MSGKNMNEWISVNDELPVTTGIPFTRYLVMHVNRLDNTLLWMSIQYWVTDKWDMEGVTHWMPLPEPPVIKDYDYELNSDPDGGTLCGKLNRKHRMKRFSTMDTHCIYPGCDACQ